MPGQPFPGVVEFFLKIALPIPEEAPVTRATFCCVFVMMISCFLMMNAGGFNSSLNVNWKAL